MNVVYLLLPLALLLALAFVGLFLWANKHGQFDDLDSPGKRLLVDDVPIAKEDTSKTSDKPNQDQP